MADPSLNQTVLFRFMSRQGVASHGLSARSRDLFPDYSVAKSTIQNWRSGQVRSAQDWRSVAVLAQLLNLSESEADELLESLGCMTVAHLRTVIGGGSDRMFLKAWPAEERSPEQDNAAVIEGQAAGPLPAGSGLQSSEPVPMDLTEVDSSTSASATVDPAAGSAPTTGLGRVLAVFGVTSLLVASALWVVGQSGGDDSGSAESETSADVATTPGAPTVSSTSPASSTSPSTTSPSTTKPPTTEAIRGVMCPIELVDLPFETTFNRLDRVSSGSGDCSKIVGASQLGETALVGPWDESVEGCWTGAALRFWLGFVVDDSVRWTSLERLQWFSDANPTVELKASTELGAPTTGIYSHDELRGRVDRLVIELDPVFPYEKNGNHLGGCWNKLPAENGKGLQFYWGPIN